MWPSLGASITPCLYAIEQMCGVRAVPCVAPDRLVADALGSVKVPPPKSPCSTACAGSRDMAHLAAGYAGKLGAARVQIAGAADSRLAAL